MCARKRDAYDVLGATSRRVLYCIVDAADNQIPPSRTVDLFRKDIARKTGLSLRRISEVVAMLVEQNYLSIERRQEPNAGHVATRYTILNPDRGRHEKIKRLAESTGFPLASVNEWVYWLHHHRDKIASLSNPTAAHIMQYSHCPEDQIGKFLPGLLSSGILVVHPNGGGAEVRF